MKLILKTSLGLLLGLGVTALIAPSYLGTAVDGVVQTCKNQVPIDFEIERASGLIKKVEPQIDACKREVAQAEVNLENLEADFVVAAEKVAASEAKVKHGASLLGGGALVSTASLAASASSASASTRDRVALNLKRSFEAFKNERELLATKQKLRERQRAAADAARSRLDAVRAEKARLEDMVASLRVQKAQVDALAATSPNVKLDDSALGEAKKVLAEIKNRLDVTQKMLEDDMLFVVGGVGVAGASEPPVQADVVLAEIQEFMASAPARDR